MMRHFALIFVFFALVVPAFAESVTAARVIRPQTTIGPEDLGILPRIVPGALSTSSDLIGLEARVTLYPGRPILPEHVGPPALVERNQPVEVVFRKHTLTIVADGRALSRGAIGDTVRVMNLASRSTVSGTVQPDGTIVVGQRGVLK